MELGEYLRGLREAKGLSVRQLADQLGLESSYVSKIEHGDRVPSKPVLETLAGVLDVSPDVLEALAGRMSEGLLEAVKRHPEEFVTLLKALQKAPKQTLVRAARAVRDGDW